MAVSLVIGIAVGAGGRHNHSGAAGVPALSASSFAGRSTEMRVAAPERCPDARRGLAYYVRRTNDWRRQMREAATKPARSVTTASCNYVHYLVAVWLDRAAEAHSRFEHWYAYAWQEWLPAKFYRVARCETHLRWDWDSGRYVSAFGIYRPAYERYHIWLGDNTPREQYQVANAIRARFGWGAWGCGSA